MDALIATCCNRLCETLVFLHVIAWKTSLVMQNQVLVYTSRYQSVPGTCETPKWIQRYATFATNTYLLKGKIYINRRNPNKIWTNVRLFMDVRGCSPE